MARRTFTVNYKNGLNIREKPTKRSKVLSVLKDGEKVVLDNTKDSAEGWAAVKTGGYVMTRYLK